MIEDCTRKVPNTCPFFMQSNHFFSFLVSRIKYLFDIISIN